MNKTNPVVPKECTHLSVASLKYGGMLGIKGRFLFVGSVTFVLAHIPFCSKLLEKLCENEINSPGCIIGIHSSLGCIFSEIWIHCTYKAMAILSHSV